MTALGDTLFPPTSLAAGFALAPGQVPRRLHVAEVAIHQAHRPARPGRRLQHPRCGCGWLPWDAKQDKRANAQQFHRSLGRGGGAEDIVGQGPQEAGHESSGVRARQLHADARHAQQGGYRHGRKGVGGRGELRHEVGEPSPSLLPQRRGDVSHRPLQHQRHPVALCFGQPARPVGVQSGGGPRHQRGVAGEDEQLRHRPPLPLEDEPGESCVDVLGRFPGAHQLRDAALR